MPSTSLIAAAAIIALSPAPALAGFGAGGYLGFTNASVGTLSGGTLTAQPAFAGKPGPGRAADAFTPRLSGGTLIVPIPAGRHSNHWWGVFAAFQAPRIAAVIAAGPVSGRGGAGVPGPEAGTGLGFLALAAAGMLIRRKTCMLR